MNTTTTEPINEPVAPLGRAVLYARVSYDDRDTDGRNLQSQLDMGRERAKEKGYQIVAELPEDEKGASGADIDLPKLSRIREMARNREFDVLVVRELDRLSRNLAKQLIVEEELRQCGVRIEYVLAEYADSPEGRLQKHLRATIAEFEREKIKERSVRGRRSKIKQGKVIVHGRPPYGFRLNDDKSALIVYEPEAATIRLIFDWCINEGLSNRAITQRLNEMEVPTPPSAVNKSQVGWWMSTISRMLRNDLYIGLWHYGKNGSQGKNASDTWLTIKLPAIVDASTWKAAQKKLANNKRFSRRNRKYDYLFSGRTTCGCGCEYHLTGTSRGDYHYYSKMFSNVRLKPCQAPYFRADHVDEIVWKWVKDLLTEPAALAQGLAHYRAEHEARIAPLRDRLSVVTNLLTEYKTKQERLLDVYLSGDIDKEIFVTHKSQLEASIVGLEREEGNLTVQIEQNELTSEQVHEINEFAEMIRADVELITDDFEARRKIIDLLDTQIKLTVEDGQKVVYISCRLGRGKLSIMMPKRSFLQ